MSDDPSFKIRDRRHSAGDEPATEPAADTAEQAAPDAPTGPSGTSMPAIDFSTFLLSLGTSALVHLGETATPEGQTERSLPLAQQVIDILALIRTKTRGNLDPEESRLLEELLYDLRLRYVNAAR